MTIQSETIPRFEAAGSKVVADGEQAKESFAVHPLHGLMNIAAGRYSDPIRGWQARAVSPYPIGGRSSDDPKLKIGR
jgi:hypothetical protein